MVTADWWDTCCISKQCNLFTVKHLIARLKPLAIDETVLSHILYMICVLWVEVVLCSKEHDSVNSIECTGEYLSEIIVFGIQCNSMHYISAEYYNIIHTLKANQRLFIFHCTCISVSL